MKTIEKATITVGCVSITMNTIGVLLSNQTLNYGSLFLGRIAALLFSIAIDKNRSYYYLPISISLINGFLQSQTLLFVELLFQSIVYQFSAYNLFKKKN